MEPTLILSPQCFVKALLWDFDECLRNTQPVEVPAGCPVGRSLVPLRLRKCLITWAHTAVCTGHPGTRRTHELLKEKYWWENMVQATTWLPVPPAPKRKNHFPAGQIISLPRLYRPWSHIAVDFIIDLPKSEGKTVILVITNQFSRSLRLILLESLPTAFKLVELMFNQVFNFFGLPEDVVSDHGPQFT